MIYELLDNQIKISKDSTEMYIDPQTFRFD